MDVPESHYLNVGKVAIAAANAEAGLAEIVAASKGQWGEMNWLSHLAEMTESRRLRTTVTDVAARLNRIAAWTALGAEVDNLGRRLAAGLEERNRIVHSTVLRSIWPLGDVPSGEVAMAHPKTLARRTLTEAVRELPSDAEVASLVVELDEIRATASRLSGRVAVAAEQGVFRSKMEGGRP